MSEREYIVSLNRGVDHVAFNQEMIASTGAGAIPSRSATVTDERATNVRNTHYDLTDAEAEALTTFGIIGIKVWIYKGEVFAREFSQETNKVKPKEVKE